jgi:hypothetical protein
VTNSIFCSLPHNTYFIVILQNMDNTDMSYLTSIFVVIEQKKCEVSELDPARCSGGREKLGLTMPESGFSKSPRYFQGIILEAKVGQSSQKGQARRCTLELWKAVKFQQDKARRAMFQAWEVSSWVADHLMLGDHTNSAALPDALARLPRQLE